MNRVIICMVLVVGSVCRPLNAQVLPVSASGNMAVIKPELDQIVSDYEAQERIIDAEIQPPLKIASDRYAASLEALGKKYSQSNHLEQTNLVLAESQRFSQYGLDAEPAKTAPAEIRSAWAIFQHDVANANESVSFKRNAARDKLLQSLGAIEQVYRAKNDSEGITLAHQVRIAISIRYTIRANLIATTEIAGNSDNPLQDIMREGGYIVGFNVGMSPYEHKFLGSAQPIFATAHGICDGAPRGNHGGIRVIARNGYAVGGLIVRSGVALYCIQIIFMKINPDGVSLNPQDSYTTDWLGGEGGETQKELNLHGHMPVGVTGKVDDNIRGIGLIYLK